MNDLNFTLIHPTWRPLLQEALAQVDPHYLQLLRHTTNWLPGPHLIFNAFSRPVKHVNYILFGESPYPRRASANGCAFWDAAVNELWSKQGLATTVNRATSLRNILKMLLVAEGCLKPNDTSQAAITMIDKNHFVTTLTDLFNNFQDHGILLLNASLVFRKNQVHQDAKAWAPFMDKLLELLKKQQPTIELVLLGKVAQRIAQLPHAAQYKQFHAEHPYNISFIHNKNVLEFFRPLRLLRKG